MAAVRPVTVDEYVRYHEQGFLIVRGLVSRADVDELLAHVEDEIPGGRVHFLHRRVHPEARLVLAFVGRPHSSSEGKAASCSSTPGRRPTPRATCSSSARSL